MRISLSTVITILALSSPVCAKDQGYFNCFRYGMSEMQKEEFGQWFRSDGVSRCCDLSDGMPGFAEDREDGVYIPPYDKSLEAAVSCRDHPEAGWDGRPPTDRSDWVQVEYASILKKNNPVGVVVIWWVTQWISTPSGGNKQIWKARCLANLSRG